MHRFRASLIVALLVAASLMLSGPAGAGGPTSALLSVPGEGTTASLYYTDPEYDALANLVGIGTSTGTETGNVDKSGVGHETGPGVTVTWLIHDVTPWRVDRIYLEGKGAPWIATQISMEAGRSGRARSCGTSPRRRPSSRRCSTSSASVRPPARRATSTAWRAPRYRPRPSPLPRAPTSRRRQSASPFAGIWWGLGGLAAGVLLTVLWMRRSRADADPAREPGDVHADAPGLVVAEELSWPAPRA